MCTLLHPFLCNTLLAAGAAAWPHSAAGEGLVSPEIAQGNFGCTLYQPKQVSRLRDRTRNNIMAIYEMMGWGWQTQSGYRYIPSLLSYI